MKIKYTGYQPTKTDVNIDYDDMALPRGGSDVYRLAPKKPSNSPMPKVKPPKDDWEIPSFMKNFKPKETVTFYDMEGRAVFTSEVE